MSTPSFEPIIDLEVVRHKLRRAESSPGRMRDVWNAVRRMAYAEPDRNQWYTPFVAAVEQDEDLARHAKHAIDGHLASAEERGSAGYLFNIWCFAFPHCRWAIWFDVLRQAGFYTREEADQLGARFLLIQHRDHHAGLRVKPYPECVDNQAASLCLSSVVVGTLFADSPGGGHLARYMREEGARRLEAMIGGMPASGYSGEGSTYQGRIVAFAIPFLVEMLERIENEEIFDRPLPPNGTSAEDILRMTSRLWMPGGLLLPWDDYGYQFGLKFPLAYLAHRTGDEHALALLEHVANWPRMGIESGGWGFDEAVWALAFWPQREAPVRPPRWSGWSNDEVGGTLVSEDGSRYLMQMWDPTGAMCTRSQVNPNSLVLEADGVPLTADGAKEDDCEAIHWPDAVHERAVGSGHVQRVDLSKGVAGAHNCILVDGRETMRPGDDYERSRLVSHDPEDGAIAGDVTGLYADVFDDCRLVRRRSRLVEDRFWLVEDMVQFDDPHEFTSRWYFRPGVEATENGVDLRTPEGVGLQMRSLLGEVSPSVERIEGFPRDPDGCSDRMDCAKKGRTARWLWALWPVAHREVLEELSEGWRAAPLGRDASGGAVRNVDARTDMHPGGLPWMQAGAPVADAYGLCREVSVPAEGNWFLRLPRGISHEVRLWIDGEEVEIPGPVRRARLLPPYVPCPEKLTGQSTVEIALLMPLETGHENGEHNLTNTPDGAVAVCAPVEAPETMDRVVYEADEVRVELSTGENLRVSHQLMQSELEE